MEKYKKCGRVTDEECYIGNHTCETCMYLKCKRSKSGFPLCDSTWYCGMVRESEGEEK